MTLPTPRSNGIALITGASSGIGADIARELAKRGHRLLLVARRIELLDQLAGELSESFGVVAETLSVDLASVDARNGLIEKIKADGLEVDILINNAGFGLEGRFWEMDPERQDEMIELNVHALHHLTRAVIDGMVSRRSGAILLVASAAAFQPVVGFADYAASKAFVLSLGEALHAELKSKGVSVMTLCPGPVKTEFWDLTGSEGSPVTRGGGLPTMWISSPKVAALAVEGLEQGKRTVIPNPPVKALAIGARYTPRTILLAGMRRLG